MSDDEFMRRVRARQSEKSQAEARKTRDYEQRAQQENLRKERQKYAESKLISVAESAMRRHIPTIAIFIVTEGLWGATKYKQAGSGWEIVPATSPAEQDRWQESCFDLGKRGVFLRNDGRAFCYARSFDGRAVLKSASSKDGTLPSRKGFREEWSQISIQEDLDLVINGLVEFAADHDLQVG
jgi:hypothetical protein